MECFNQRGLCGIAVLFILTACGIPTTPSNGLPERLWGQPTCAVAATDRRQKADLRQASLEDTAALDAYREMVREHAARLQECRNQTWPQTQSVWLRLYPHDAQPGVLADVLDRIVNRGYNQVFVEVFYEGRVMLPVGDNPTVWRSILEEAVAAGEVAADFDLWAETVRQGQARGLEVHGWMFALNFGWAYGEIPDRQQTLALNGLGETSIAKATWDPDEVSDGRAFYEDPSELEHLFVDPYSETARADFAVALEALLARNPDGILFDYIRYPTVYLQDTIVTQPEQLWIYGPASRRALAERLPSDRERRLMDLYLETGDLTVEQIQVSVRDEPNSPLPFEPEGDDWVNELTEEDIEPYRQYFWALASDQAYRGVLDFADFATKPVTDLELPVATVFFPQGNRAADGGFDARMQPWNRFADPLERHPMSYATCEDGSCVVDQVKDVVLQSPNSRVCPILAGTWGQEFGGHLALEDQMNLLEATLQELECVSHFVYAWMEPDSDRARKAGTGVGEDAP